jgi:hypothetical protein
MAAHEHNFDGRWPFDESKDITSFCCEHVFGGVPILYVTHDHDGDWQFLCGQTHQDSLPRLVCIGCMLERDPTLWTLADMPAGWGADRQNLNDSWNREPNPEPLDE